MNEELNEASCADTMEFPMYLRERRRSSWQHDVAALFALKVPRGISDYSRLTCVDSISVIFVHLLLLLHVKAASPRLLGPISESGL